MESCMGKYLLSSLLVFSLILPAYSQVQETQILITKEQAVEIAKQYSTNEISITLDWDNTPVAATFKNGKWYVLFSPDDGYLGGHFMITIPEKVKLKIEEFKYSGGM